MLFVLLAVMLLVYLGIGAKVARTKYALSNFVYQEKLILWQSDKKVLLTKQQNYENICYEINSIFHKSYCNLHFSILSKNGCNCEHADKWRKLKVKADYATVVYEPAPEEPSVPVLTVLWWPGTVVGNYIKGGTVKKPNYALIEKMQFEELGIKE